MRECGAHFRADPGLQSVDEYEFGGLAEERGGYQSPHCKPNRLHVISQAGYLWCGFLLDEIALVLEGTLGTRMTEEA